MKILQTLEGNCYRIKESHERGDPMMDVYSEDDEYMGSLNLHENHKLPEGKSLIILVCEKENNFDNHYSS